MIVMKMAAVPRQLRGAISVYMYEPAPNLFVGMMSAKIRDELWEACVRLSGTGWAWMVYQDRSVQRLVFRSHQTPWKPVDFDGITLIQRPLTPEQ